MADFDLNELITAAHREAFAAMWPQEREAAKAEARRLLELVAKPAEHLTDTQSFARRLLLGLVGDEPDASAWMQAVAAGSLQLRPDQRYVVLRDNEKPARFVERGLKTYDDGVDARQRRAGITDKGVRDGLHLLGFLLLAKEFKNLATGPATLGPAWPLMVAVDSHLTNDEKRMLHASGADEGLQRKLADALKAALGAFAANRDTERTPMGGRAANWRRELPPKAYVESYFQAKRADTAAVATDVHSRELRQMEEAILRGPRPSFLPPEVEERSFADRSPPLRLALLLPHGDATGETFSKAIRAIARKKAREEAVTADAPEVHSDDFKVQVWLRSWARRGGGIPPEMPVIYFGYLEEEACLAFETFGNDWPGAAIWRNYGVIGREPSRTRPEELPWEFWDDDLVMTWVKPPRKIDRIDI